MSPSLIGRCGGGGSQIISRDSWRSDVVTINNTTKPLTWDPGNEFGPDFGIFEPGGAFDALVTPTTGVYAVTIQVSPQSAMVVGQFYSVFLELDHGGVFPYNTQQQSPVAQAGNLFPGPVTVSLTWPIISGVSFAGVYVQISSDGVGAVDYRADDIALCRIS